MLDGILRNTDRKKEILDFLRSQTIGVLSSWCGMGRMDDLDIYRTANELIKQHGADAAIHAAMRADELLEAVQVVTVRW